MIFQLDESNFKKKYRFFFKIYQKQGNNLVKTAV